MATTATDAFSGTASRRISPLHSPQLRWTEPPTHHGRYGPGNALSKADRVVVRLPGSGEDWPSVCFLVMALHALRADPEECVNFLVDQSGERAALDLLHTHASSFPSSNLTVLDSRFQLLQLHMQQAKRVVWADVRSNFPTGGRRLRAFEYVWTWCTGKCEPLLPANKVEFEVQARPQLLHRATNNNGTRSSCARSLSVRSRWTRGEWVDHVPTAWQRAEQRGALLRGEWVHDDVCLAYRHNDNPKIEVDRFNMIVQAQSSSRRLLYPLSWKDFYTEYDPAYSRLDHDLWPAHSLTSWTTWRFGSHQTPEPSNCTWHEDTTAFVAMSTMDNLYHALIHAVPIRESFKERLSSHNSKAVHVLPHYLMYWPRNGSYIGWQILMRGLGVTDAEWPLVKERARKLTMPHRCNCYKRMHFGHPSFMPPPFSPVGESIQRVTAFRQAIAASLGGPPLEPKRRILFQLRKRGEKGSRQISNVDEFQAAIEADPVLGSRVRFAVMEALPVMEQYALISQSYALAGVHGMGLAWTMLLPSDARGASSCLEILGMWPSFQRNDYYQLSKANGVYYLRMQQRSSRECICYGCHYRVCGNVTVNATEVAPVLKYMVRRWEEPPNTQEDTREKPRRCHTIVGNPNTTGVSCDPYLWPSHPSMAKRVVSGVASHYQKWAWPVQK